VPENHEVVLETGILSIDESVEKILDYLDVRGLV
jgi:adenylylsulfate kinase-like enzyme